MSDDEVPEYTGTGLFGQTGATLLAAAEARIEALEAERDEALRLAKFTPLVRPFGTPVTRDAVRMVWDLWVQPEQDTGAPPSIEMRVLMAILRSAYDLLPPTDSEPNDPTPTPVTQEGHEA